MATKTNSYNALVFDPQWMGDFVTPGYLEDLSSRVNADTALQWNDIAPFFRDFSATYQGKIYTIPLDGDFLMVYYRSDLLAKDGLQAARHLGRLPDDRQEVQRPGPERRRHARLRLLHLQEAQRPGVLVHHAVAGAYIQSMGTNQGAFFDTTDMKPLTNNDAFAAALDIYKPDYQVRAAGRAEWTWETPAACSPPGAAPSPWTGATSAPLAIDPTTSKVQDKVGAVILPGSKQVLDRTTGKLVDCNATNCPNAINGINHAPFAAFGGWSGAINAADDPKVKDAAYDFLSYVSQPAQSSVDVTLGKTGFNPYRTSQFTEPGPVAQGRHERRRRPRTTWALSRTA